MDQAILANMMEDLFWPAAAAYRLPRAAYDDAQGNADADSHRDISYQGANRDAEDEPEDDAGGQGLGHSGSPCL